MDRLIIAHTPLPSHQLLFRSLSGEEKLAGLFEFDVELLSPDNRLDLKALLGQKITLELRGNPLAPRYLNGNITRMTLSGREAGGNRYYIYRAVLRPTLWYLTQNRDFRIYQEKTVPDILTQVLGQYQVKIDNRLSYDYRIWGYCVQYQESDFDFISRLMEHEGIYYYFTHQQDGHTLVLADAPSAHQELAGYASIPYQLAEGGLVENKDSINSWSVSDAITPSLYSLDDYDFRKPRARLLEARQNPASFAQDKAEVFDWLRALYRSRPRPVLRQGSPAGVRSAARADERRRQFAGHCARLPFSTDPGAAYGGQPRLPGGQRALLHAGKQLRQQ